jgi:hypothetical protein
MSRQLSRSSFLQCDERPSTYEQPISDASSMTLLELSKSGVPVSPKIAFLAASGLLLGSLVMIPNSSLPARLFFSLKISFSLLDLFDASTSSFVQQRLSYERRVVGGVLERSVTYYAEATTRASALHGFRLR